MTCDDGRVALAAGLHGEQAGLLWALGRVSGAAARRLPAAPVPGRG